MFDNEIACEDYAVPGMSVQKISIPVPDSKEREEETFVFDGDELKEIYHKVFVQLPNGKEYHYYTTVHKFNGLTETINGVTFHFCERHDRKNVVKTAMSDRHFNRFYHRAKNGLTARQN